MKVLIPQKVHETTYAFLEEKGYEVIRGTGWDVETLKREIADVDAVLCRLAPYTRDVIEAGKNLKLLARHGVGYENVDLAAAADCGVIVTNSRGGNTRSVAEHTLTMLLACAKHLVYFDRETRAGGWSRMRGSVDNLMLTGQTLGIIGIGAIGKTIAQITHDGLGMKIIAFDQYADRSKLPDYVTMTDDLNELLAVSDFVTVHCPSSPETMNLVNKTNMALMKPTAILVNCARGGIVNEDDLYDVLKEKRIFAAGVDAMLGEPIYESKLFTLDNFIISPHTAGQTEDSEIRLALGAAHAIDAVLNGKKPESLVLYPENARIKLH